MTFSYSADPGTSPLDAVRFLVGDTESDEVFLQNEEINWLVTQWLATKGTIYYVASKAAEAIASKFARETTFSADGQTVALDNLADKFTQLAESLREQHEDLLVGGSSLYVGGVDANEQPAWGVRPPNFGTQMHDIPAAGNQEYGNAKAYYGNRWAWGEEVP